MLKNVKKLAISKQLLISLILVTIMFTAFSFNVESSCAVTLNETDDDLGVELDVEDKLENSQTNEILSTSYSANGGTYSDIQKLVDKASAGDTITLKGTFSAKSSSDIIKVNKKLTITSSSTATLDGKKLSNAFQLQKGSAGSTISNLIFTNGYSKNEGGAIRITAKNIVIDNCQFKNNNAKDSSGAIHTSYTPKVAQGLTIKNCKFTGNTAGTAAGAVGVFGYNFKIDNCVFDSNSVSSKNNCYGGAIQVGLDKGLSKGVVSNCKFTNNKATSSSGTSHGGAGCLRNGTTYKNCEFTGNSADHGGAITFHASGKLENCKFKNNKANDYGGALSIALEQKTMVLTINKCTFSGNTAPIGGAAKLDGMNIKIQNSNFTSNKATKYGGAVYIDAKDVTILKSNFKKNTVNINGGAVYIKGKNTVINKSSFVSNEAIPDVKKLNDGLGGAVYVDSTQASVNSNTFKLNTARNGSAIYYDKSGTKLTLKSNKMAQNQAWVYLLPIKAHDIDYGEVEEISSVIYGGNNIAKYNDLAVSNAIYNAAKVKNIEIDGQNPVLGATMSGKLYQDSREYNMKILLTVTHEDGTVVYNKTLSSSYLGEVSDNLTDLRPGKYYVKSTHFEDTYYKGITNTTTFRVTPKVDNRILKTSNPSDEYNYEDKVVWTLDITNNGPNDATDVVVRDVLPEGLIYESDDSEGKYNPKTGILTIGNLAIGEHVIVNIITTINKTGEITNDANVTSKEYDIDLTNNYDNATISVNPAIDLCVVKSVNNSEPNYGEILDWKLVVSNNGPDVAHNVKVEDILPKSLICLDFTGNYDQNAGIWQIGTLDVGEKVILHLITKVNATGRIENHVSVSGDELDHDPTNNFDKADVDVAPASDLTIKKSVNASTANYDDLVKWTLEVTNNGPDDGTGVYVLDVLPRGFVYVDSNLERGTYDNGKITIGNLAVGETLKLDILCRVKNTGKFINIANITGNEFDQDLSNNEDNESIYIYPAADLEIVKEVNESNPKYNNSIIWSLTVRNNGPNDANEVKVYDALPKSLIWINDDSNGKYDYNAGVWHIGQLANKASVKLNIICKVNATGLSTNFASVTGREYDYNLSNNHDNETIDVEPAADVAIEKSVNNTRPNYHDLVKWTIIITNNGPDQATDVCIDEVLPEGLVLVNHSATKGIYGNGLWAMCCLNKTEVESLEIICLVNKTGEITNIVSISAKEYDPNPRNNNDEESIHVPPAVDLELIKDVNNTDPEFGDVINWFIAVKNNGPDVATGVKVEDILPDGLILKDCQSSKGDYIEGIWNIGSLSAGDVEYLNITCIVDKLGEITNYAEVSSNEYDWNESNNYDVSSVEATPVVDLSIMKLVNNTVPNYGDIIKWTLIVTNNGPNDASEVMVYDTLPDGVSLIETLGGNYEDGIWDIGDLNAGDSIELEILCKVISTGSFTNFASVVGDENDPDLTNNEDNESIDVPPASDISITKIATKYYYALGDIVRYAIEVVNNGPNSAENVKVSEIMENSLKLKSFKASAGDFDKLTKTWDVGPLDIGESASLDIEAVATKKGILNNTVRASSENYDPDLSNNEDYASVNVLDNETDTPKTSEHPKGIVNENAHNEFAKKILEKNVSGNSFFILVFSLIFSLIFLRRDIFKRK